MLAVAVRRDGEGRPAWYRISLPGRPNGRTGWVPAASVDLKPVRKEIVIDRSDRTLELRDGGRLLLSHASRSAPTGWRRRSAAST